MTVKYQVEVEDGNKNILLPPGGGLVLVLNNGKAGLI
jgi:hypothetical protein